jgi:hypothetical protein
MQVFTPVFTDDFRRADASPIGPPQWDLLPSVFGGALAIVNEVCVPGLPSGGGQFPDVFVPNDQYVSMTIGNIVDPGGQAILFVRAAPDVSTYYALTLAGIGGGLYDLGLVHSGVGTIWHANPFSAVKGDIITLAAVGSTLSIYHNGIFLGSAVDTSYTSGTVGLALFFSTTPNDNPIEFFECGRASGTIPAPTLTPSFTDTFTRANEDPLKTANWQVASLNLDLSVFNNQCVTGTISGIARGLENYIGSALPNNQFASATVGAIVGGNVASEVTVYVRGSNGNGYIAALRGDGEIVLSIEPTETPFLFLSIPPPIAGDVITVAAVGPYIYVLYNGVVFGSMRDTSASSGGASLSVAYAVSRTDTAVSKFQTGSAAGGIISPYYSVPDCRNYATFPNRFQIVNGTFIYDVQLSSNKAVPSADCRTAGDPIPCGTYPQNSRTPGTFGPGE